MNYASKKGICQFARVLHVRDLCCAYAFLLHALAAFSNALRKPGSCPAGPGPTALVPGRHEAMPARLERSRGAAVGGVQPPSSNHHRGSSQRPERLPFPCVRMHATYARIVRALGHSTYLMITVPIDTTLIIKHLQLFYSKMWCQIVLF